MDHVKEFPVIKMSKVLKVSRSGYYKWINTKDKKAEEKAILAKIIVDTFNDCRGNYGSPRLCVELKKKGIDLSKSTVARRMQDLNIAARIKKIFKHTTDSNHEKKVSPNLLNRQFDVSELGKYWVSDITYIRVKHSFVYLTIVLDLADRMVVGWSLSNNMTDKHTTIAALKKAVKFRPIQPGLIFHSDRGSQYASDDFRELLDDYECIQSMSRKGNCWDNAVAESFFKTIKVESLYRYKFESFDETYTAVFDYIDGWYNTRRIHTSLDGMSPSEFFQILQYRDLYNGIQT